MTLCFLPDALAHIRTQSIQARKDAFAFDLAKVTVGHYYGGQEDAAGAACYAAAAVDGHSVDQADQCGNGAHKCSGCPFYASQAVA
ncbi:hypothetical protein AAKU55_005731 [Oxalobacteraceae bacterium GrIS 1.11]